MVSVASLRRCVRPKGRFSIIADSGAGFAVEGEFPFAENVMKVK